MSSKSKPIGKAELAAYDAKRDLAAELPQSVREMKAGRVRAVSTPAIEGCPTVMPLYCRPVGDYGLPA